MAAGDDAAVKDELTAFVRSLATSAVQRFESANNDVEMSQATLDMKRYKRWLDYLTAPQARGSRFS